MEKRKVSVLVAGQRFNIITEEEEKYVLDLASRIDARINSISIGQGMTREGAAVLTALDLADEGEHNKRELGEIKEQIKDYLTQIASLSDENEKLKAELSKAQLCAEELNGARATIAASDKEKESLKKQIYALKDQIALMQSVGYPTVPSEEEAPAQEPQTEAAPEPVVEEEQPVEEAPAVQPAPADITAEDDLFFDAPQEEPVKLSRKEKKNRHDHSHVNPYKQQFMQKQNDQKGYTQQRQYSLFDTDE